MIQNLENEKEKNSKIKQIPIKYKVCFIGSCGTGAKTSLIKVILGEKCDSSELATSGSSYDIKPIKLKNNQIIELYLWDNPGQDKYINLSKIPKLESDCFVIGFDITSRYSFNEINYWYQIAKECSNTNLMYLIGNKSDLYDLRDISEDEARNLANKLNLRYFEVSCVTRSGIDQFVEDLANEVAKY